MKSQIILIGNNVLEIKRRDPEPEEIYYCNILIQCERENQPVAPEAHFIELYQKIEHAVLRLPFETSPALNFLIYKLSREDEDVANLLIAGLAALGKRWKTPGIGANMFLTFLEGDLLDYDALEKMAKRKSIRDLLSNPVSWSV